MYAHITVRLPTDVSWAPYDPSSEYIDVSPYVTVAFNQTSQAIDFTVTTSMAGVRDYPAKVRWRRRKRPELRIFKCSYLCHIERFQCEFLFFSSYKM